MCGIVGMAGKGTSAGLKQAMKCIAPRGPDEQRTWNAAQVAFGHARLAIVDLSSTGRQPMSRRSNTVVFNGEIYNHSALREELKKEGVAFKGTSDTEVLLALYEKHGVDCLEKLEGMFAFALWDKKKDQLFVARDRFGQKPLIYAIKDDTFYFASTIPALLELIGPRAIDPNGLQQYMLHSMLHIPAPYTGYEGVSKLRAGSCGLFKDGVFMEKQWYTPTFGKQSARPAEQLSDVLGKTVKEMLDCDVPVAAFLSGGTDSALVSSYLTESVKDLRTYSLGADAQEDDLVRADAIAKDIGSEHTQLLAQNVEFLDSIERIVDELGEPFVQTSAVFSLAICEQLQGKGKVLFSGAAGDELFYGYDNRLFLRAQFARNCMRLLGNLVAKLFQSLLARLGSRASALAAPGNYKPALFRFDAQQNLARFTPTMRQGITDDAGAEAHRILSAASPPTLVDEFYLSGLLIDNVHSIQTLSDATGMAFGIEIRNPFLEREVVEYAMRIPYKKKVGFLSSKGDKKMLKQLLHSRLSKAKWAVHGRKHGFGSSFSPLAALTKQKQRVVDMCYNCSRANILTEEAVSATLENCFAHGNTAPVLKLYALGYWLSTRKLSL